MEINCKNYMNTGSMLMHICTEQSRKEKLYIYIYITVLFSFSEVDDYSIRCSQNK